MFFLLPLLFVVHTDGTLEYNHAQTNNNNNENDRHQQVKNLSKTNSVVYAWTRTAGAENSPSALLSAAGAVTSCGRDVAWRGAAWWSRPSRSAASQRCSCRAHSGPRTRSTPSIAQRTRPWSPAPSYSAKINKPRENESIHTLAWILTVHTQ